MPFWPSYCGRTTVIISAAKWSENIDTESRSVGKKLGGATMAKICPRCKKNPLLADHHRCCPSCLREEKKNASKGSTRSAIKDRPEKAKKCPYCNKRILPPGRDACLTCRPDYKITGDPCKTADGGYEVLVQTYQHGKQIGPVEFEWQ